MEVLYWFESIRSPFLTKIMSAVTWLGHEILPVAFICLLFWCISKKTAYKMAFAFVFSGLTVQMLKIGFRIDRPWIIDPNFKPVDSAVGAATGYSFPSGHTQAATSLYGSLAMCLKKWWQKLICVLLILIIGVSRLYLGVHTPLDVVTAFCVTAVMTVAVCLIMDRIYETKRYDLLVSGAALILSLAAIIYAAVMMESGVIEYKYASDCCKSGGAGLAFAIGYYIERRSIDFDVKTKKWWYQIPKFAVGIGVALGAKSLLKLLFAAVIPADTLGALFGEIIRYFLLVFWIVVLYPLILKAVKKVSKNG